MAGKTVKIRFNGRWKGDAMPCGRDSLFPPEAVHQRLLYLSVAPRIILKERLTLIVNIRLAPD